MPDSKRAAVTGGPVGRRTFSTAFRGFDQEEVRAYLEALAHEFRELRERIAELEGELAAEKDRPAVVDAPKVDVATITTVLGEETARVLRTAQEAADDLRTRAEEGAARTLKDAHEEAARVRGAAESVLAERTSEAEAEATAIRRDADEVSTKLRREATAEAESTVAKAVEQGRDMLAQAQAARERVLSDLARRRKIALGQLDALRAGRERLHTRLVGARGELDRMMDELARSDEEARRAEEAVGHVAPPAGGVVEEPADRGDRPDLSDGADGADGADAPDGPDTTEGAAAERPAAEPDDGPLPEGRAADAPEVAEEVGAADAGATAPSGDNAGEGAPPPADVAPVVAVAVAVAAADAASAGPGEKAPAAPERAARARYRHDPVPAGALPVDAVGESAADEAAGGKVDELFARIRADRAQKVDEARAVLAADTVAPSGGTATVRGTTRAGAGAGGARAAGGTDAPATAAVDDPALEAPRSDQDEAYLQRRDALLDKPLASTLRAVKRGLADDQNAALERLRTARGAIGVDALLGDEAAYLAQVASWATAGLGASSKAGTALAGGGDAPLAAAAVAPAAARLADGLVGPLRRRLAELLESAGDDRGADTVDRINSIYREARGRVDRLVGDAVTEVVAGAFTAALPPGTPVRWVVEDVDGPCPDCDDNALGGATPLGQPFPTGQPAPPAHPGCRCALAPAPT